MRDGDVLKIAEFLPQWKKHVGAPGKIVLHSPAPQENELFRSQFVGSNFEVVGQNSWDLDTGVYPGRCDLFVACNTFMCSRDPKKWFENLFKSTKFLFVQDLVRSPRSPTGEYTDDGDCARYSLPGVIEAKVENAFDLSVFKENLLEFQWYNPLSGNPSISFIALFKSNSC